MSQTQSEHFTPPLPDTLTPSTTPVYSDPSTILPPQWGRLVPRRTFFVAIDLRKDSYVLGRKDTCDILINGYRMEPTRLNIISKEHFMISRDSTLVPYIKDLSKNGTYLNGMVIGQNKVTTLCDGDIIAIGHITNEVYQFKDESTQNVSLEFDEKYKMTRILGNGAFGEVYLAYSKKTTQRYAVKKIKIEKKHESKIKNEVKILEALQHPCVIHMLEAVYGPRGFLYIVLEYMEGGELQNRVLRHRRLSEPIAKLYIYQIVLAVRYLHDRGITHRDLKPENVLLATRMMVTRVKVTDFGLSKMVGESCVMRSLCGTPLYVAPEILRGDGRTVSYTPLVDVWSLGCVAYFALFGRTPFHADADDADADDSSDCLRRLFTRIKRGQYTIPVDAEDCSQEDPAGTVSHTATELIVSMLVVDPTQRIGVDDIIGHEWFSDNAMLKSCNKLLSLSTLTE